MPILPVNRNERAWFGFSTHSRRQATAITVAHKHETFSRNLAPDAVGGSGSGKHGVDVRRKGSRTIRRVGPRVRRQTISKQNQSCAEQRCGRGAAAQTHSGVLRLLRLAFVSARALAACETAAHVSKCTICRAGARGTAKKSYRGKFEAGSCVSSRRRPRQFRTACTDWRGCCNCALNCANGTTIRRARCRRICVRSKTQQSND